MPGIKTGIYPVFAQKPGKCLDPLLMFFVGMRVADEHPQRLLRIIVLVRRNCGSLNVIKVLYTLINISTKYIDYKLCISVGSRFKTFTQGFNNQFTLQGTGTSAK